MIIWCQAKIAEFLWEAELAELEVLAVGNSASGESRDLRNFQSGGALRAGGGLGGFGEEDGCFGISQTKSAGVAVAVEQKSGALEISWGVLTQITN